MRTWWPSCARCLCKMTRSTRSQVQKSMQMRSRVHLGARRLLGQRKKSLRRSAILGTAERRSRHQKYVPRMKRNWIRDQSPKASSEPFITPSTTKLWRACTRSDCRTYCRREVVVVARRLCALVLRASNRQSKMQLPRSRRRKETVQRSRTAALYTKGHSEAASATSPIRFGEGALLPKV